MFLLTIVGTLEQVNTSLYEVQRRYFEAPFVIHYIGALPVPLPGVSLLMAVLTVNLICGGIIRIRKDWALAGVVIAHAGILFMFFGSAVEWLVSQKGHTTLAEGETSAEFVSYFDWEILVSEPKGDGPTTELVVPGEKFMGLRSGETAAFSAAELPFELVVHTVYANCAARDSVPPQNTNVIDGVWLEELPRDKTAERDLAGAYVTIRPKAGGAPQQGLVWAAEFYPLNVTVEGRRFTIGLAHRRWQMPFTVHLDEFRQEFHPGMRMAKSFESDVTKTEDGVPQKVRISMNAPLRHRGYTLFQSGFQEPSAQTRGRWMSTFSVVRNPADRIPLWSCIVISVGLVLHFTMKLVRHVRSESRRRT
jgi:hypothetical protein